MEACILPLGFIAIYSKLILWLWRIESWKCQFSHGSVPLHISPWPTPDFHFISCICPRVSFLYLCCSFSQILLCLVASLTLSFFFFSYCPILSFWPFFSQPGSSLTALCSQGHSVLLNFPFLSIPLLNQTTFCLKMGAWKWDHTDFFLCSLFWYFMLQHPLGSWKCMNRERSGESLQSWSREGAIQMTWAVWG